MPVVTRKISAPVYAGLCADHHLAASAGPLCTTRGRGENFAGGLLLLSASFASVAVFAPTVPPEGWLRLLPSVCFVALLTLGQMLLVPSAKDLVPRFAEESTLARTTAHSPPQAALRCCWGICCLAVCWIARLSLRRRRCPRLLLALFPLCSAIAMKIICRPFTR